MTRIERREARIRRIRTQNFTERKDPASCKEVAVTPEVHCHIGKSEALPEHIGHFVMDRSGDPAVYVY